MMFYKTPDPDQSRKISVQAQAFYFKRGKMYEVREPTPKFRWHKTALWDMGMMHNVAVYKFILTVKICVKNTLHWTIH